MDVSTWWAWACSYETSLASVDVVPMPAMLTDTYQSAVDRLTGIEGYMRESNFERLVYNLALHSLIIKSGNSCVPQFRALYTGYNIESFAGMIQQASDGPSSASKFIPKGLQDGDARSIMLWSTPYGQECEATFEELKSIAIVV